MGTGGVVAAGRGPFPCGGWLWGPAIAGLRATIHVFSVVFFGHIGPIFGLFFYGGPALGFGPLLRPSPFTSIHIRSHPCHVSTSDLV